MSKSRFDDLVAPSRVTTPSTLHAPVVVGHDPPLSVQSSEVRLDSHPEGPRRRVSLSQEEDPVEPGRTVSSFPTEFDTPDPWKPWWELPGTGT